MLFKMQVAREINTLFQLSKKPTGQTFSFDQTVNLPEPARKYFSFALKEGQPYRRRKRRNHGIAALSK